MKDILKKYWKFILVGFIIFIIIIPAIINWLFKLSSPIDFFVAEWSAGDVLSFYGALLASVATIAGVYLSIEYAQRNYREDERNKIRPYFALTHIHSKSKFNFLCIPGNNSQQDQSENLYTEFRLDKVYVVISKKGIEFKTGLTNQQQQLLAQSGFTWKPVEKGIRLVATDYISLPFEVDNVGNGSAIDLQLVVYREGSDVHKGANLYTLKPTDSVYFHIFSELEDDGLLGNYMLELRYYDILGTHYAQKYPLSVERQSEYNNRVSQTIDFTGAQEIVQEEN